MATAKASKRGKTAKRERAERRFLPRTTHGVPLVASVGAAGSALLGAGAFAQYGHLIAATSTEGPMAFAPWLLGVGALLTGGALWLGTSADPVLHVGDAGVAMEKGAVRRVPWHQVASVTFDADTRAVVVQGSDEAGVALSLRAPLASQAQAAAWIVKEARARVPGSVELTEGALTAIGNADPEAGERLPLASMQIVGKRCAASGKVIAYEPEAVVCSRCERVYHASAVPDECACGASLKANSLAS